MAKTDFLAKSKRVMAQYPPINTPLSNSLEGNLESSSFRLVDVVELIERKFGVNRDSHIHYFYSFRE